MLQARFLIPILAFARTKPTMRNNVPPMSLADAPKICSTRLRKEDFLLLLDTACSVSSFQRFSSLRAWLFRFLLLSLAFVASER